MVVINDKYVPMHISGMMVGMAMRFRPLPPFMIVLMVFIVIVKMAMIYRRVLMRNLSWVTTRPSKHRKPCRG
ncbi:hypothetical protein R3F64_18765, partial [Halomonas sp. 5021]|jgi:hypothetical protein|uniref:hypothetical protein n=1 Tax=Halomonas sp. 5021 TaxID=3082156 RepID=UPI002FC6E1C1